MQDPTALGAVLTQLLFFVLISGIYAVTSHLLAKEKGRKVVRWTVLGAIPLVNFFCMFFFIGAANLRVERKLDELLRQRPS